MKVLNQPLDVESTRLTAPPKGANRLAGSGRLLVVWRYCYYISDPEGEETYCLALYHPDYGWRACRWDKAHGMPDHIYPVSESTIWISTEEDKLVRVLIGDEVRATIFASAAYSILLLYAGMETLWIRESGSNKIMQLRLQNGSLTTGDEKLIHFYASSMYPLVDGTWVLVGDRQSCVFQSSSFDEKIYEERGKISLRPPFLVQVGMDHYYYTEEPRQGWKKMPIGGKDAYDEISFFAKQDDACYAAISKVFQQEKTVLYRFSGESETSAECMWEIPMALRPDQFAMYNGLVCIADDEPLMVSGREDVPQNHGFLVWNPRSNAFYEDIPQISIMHARHIIPRNLQISTMRARHIIPHDLQIPAAPLDKKHEQNIRDVR